MVWHVIGACRGGIRDGSEWNTAKPCNAGDSGFSTIAGIAQKFPFDHIDDYRQLRLSIS